MQSSSLASGDNVEGTLAVEMMLQASCDLLIRLIACSRRGRLA